MPFVCAVPVERLGAEIAEVISYFTVCTGIFQSFHKEDDVTIVFQLNIGMLIELHYFVANAEYTLRCFLPSVARISPKYSAFGTLLEFYSIEAVDFIFL